MEAPYRPVEAMKTPRRYRGHPSPPNPLKIDAIRAPLTSPPHPPAWGKPHPPHGKTPGKPQITVVPGACLLVAGQGSVARCRGKLAWITTL
jgi:hypothetical protein